MLSFRVLSLAVTGVSICVSILPSGEFARRGRALHVTAGDVSPPAATHDRIVSTLAYGNVLTVLAAVPVESIVVCKVPGFAATRATISLATSA
jgi:hypothetical protein